MAKLNIVLHEPEIPANTGNIGRTCVATGTRLHLIEPLGFSLSEKALKRAGMDYWKDLDVTTYLDFEDFLEKNPGAKIYYATTKAPQTYTDVHYEEDCYIMFGKESAGIPEDILVNNQETCVRIPMIGDIRSLNLSNSVAIVLYEALRQNNFDHMNLEGHLRNYDRRSYMPNTTKTALEESLKRLLLKKPLDKITITDITTDCGISRMAFYYHFKDIYDLVEWSCVEDGTKALQGKKTSESWTEGLTQIFGAVLENKPFIMNVYRNVDRERIENYLFKLTYDLIVGVVEEKSKGLNITEEDKKFIADFYKYGFVGIMLEWIREGMKENIEDLVRMMDLTLHDTVTTSIHNFQKNNMEK